MVQYNTLLNFTQRGFSESITSIVRSSSWLWKRKNTSSAKVMTYRAETKHVFLHWKTSFEKNCFSAWASTLNMGLINKLNTISHRRQTYHINLVDQTHVFLQLGDGFLKRENYRINLFRKCLFYT